MLFLKISALTVLSVAELIMIFFGLKGGKPFLWLFVNALTGAAAFGAVLLARRFTGIGLPLNEWTALSSVLFGAPAVCGLLILPLIF